MKRRDFLASTIIGTAGLVSGIHGCAPKSEKDTFGSGTVTDKNGKLAGLTLAELREKHRYYLFDDFLPFLEKYVVDHEYGGFMCNTDRRGNNITQIKTAWYEGRGIWVYSFLYNNFTREQKYLDIAKKSVDFILKNEPKDGQLFAHKFSREGKPIDGPSNCIYGDLFIANGLAEFSKAAGDELYWEKAKSLLLKCMMIYDSPNYAYHVDYGPEATPFPGERVLGHWMILLRLCTQMLIHNQDAEVETVAERCVDALMNHHFIPEYNLMNEVLNHDMRRAEGPFSQFVATGHAIESLCMVMSEAVRKKDSQLFDLAAKRFRFHVNVAWDDVYGGIFHFLNNVNDNTWQTPKSLWAQEEVLVGAKQIIEHTGAQWAKELYAKMWNYVTDKFPLKQYGYPIWILYADRKVTFEEKYDRVGNFHHPRHLMLNMLSLDRMMKKHK